MISSWLWGSEQFRSRNPDVLALQKLFSVEMNDNSFFNNKAFGGCQEEMLNRSVRYLFKY